MRDRRQRPSALAEPVAVSIFSPGVLDSIKELVAWSLGLLGVGLAVRKKMSGDSVDLSVDKLRRRFLDTIETERTNLYDQIKKLNQQLLEDAETIGTLRARVAKLERDLDSFVEATDRRNQSSLLRIYRQDADERRKLEEDRRHAEVPEPASMNNEPTAGENDPMDHWERKP